MLAGTGSFSTKKTVKASKAAVEAGADGVMVVMPYYNKPSQDGMYAHVLEVAAAVDVPIVLYNIPGRSVVDLLPETTERICAAASKVVGMKEATGNVLRCQELVRRMGDRPYVTGDSFTVADVVLAHCLIWARAAKFEITEPALHAYAGRIAERPAFRRVFMKG